MHLVITIKYSSVNLLKHLLFSLRLFRKSSLILVRSKDNKHFVFDVSMKSAQYLRNDAFVPENKWFNAFVYVVPQRSGFQTLEQTLHLRSPPCGSSSPLNHHIQYIILSIGAIEFPLLLLNELVLREPAGNEARQHWNCISAALRSTFRCLLSKSMGTTFPRVQCWILTFLLLKY